jgi:phosphoserine phosphatase
MTTELRIAKLEEVLDVARRLGAEQDLDRLLELLSSSALSVLECERISIFLYDPDKEELESRVATGVDKLRIPARRGIAGACVEERKSQLVPDAYADPRFNRAIDLQTGFVTRSILAVPMFGLVQGARATHAKLVGVMQALNRRDRAFDEADVRLAETLASQAAVAIERVRMLEGEFEFRQKQRELAIARRIQEQMTPRAPLKVGEFEICGWSEPASETCGDCLDYQLLDNGKIVFLLGDAAGHGIGPALIGAACRALIRGVADLEPDLSQLLRRANRLIHGDMLDDRFITLCLGVLDPATNAIEVLSAAHEPMGVRRANGAIEWLRAHTVMLGIDKDLPAAKPTRIELGPGDALFVGSDGFLEWPSAAREQFGHERLAAALAGTCGKPPSRAIAEVVNAVHAFGMSPQPDDMTLLVIERRPA